MGLALATSAARTSDLGVQVECEISDYYSKELVELSVILFHPLGSRFTNQTTTIKRGSSIFFSGALTVIEKNLYIELHNFSFVRNQGHSYATSEKSMPWSSKESDNSASTSFNIARSIHELNKKTENKSDDLRESDKPIVVKDLDKSDKTLGRTHTPGRTRKIQPISTPNNIAQSIHKKSENKSDDLQEFEPEDLDKSDKVSEQTRRTPPTPVSTKRKTRSSYKSSNKMQKLADIASNIISVADSDVEKFDQ